ncbi:MAG TPA: isoprenyl transferase [Planctomycetota bacterium]|jgi:undecaprenyl diphosphate synthase|nr:isoprenyl transferase [Planctomycetota bacterium]
MTAADGIPRHVAIIMDGNGRWARRRRLRRVLGHRAGIRAVREVVTECARLGVESLTLYAFSVENWRRPRGEVEYLMGLLKRFLIGEREEIARNRIRLTSIGRIEDLPEDVRRELRRTEEMSAGNGGMRLCLALSYGGRAEIADAVRRIAEKAARGEIEPREVTEEVLRAHLYDATLPDPDLLIRTAGEMRVSNFLLWQISYTEFYVTPKCWPEFGKRELHEAIEEYRRRERKFGGLTPLPQAPHGSPLRAAAR